MGEKVLVSGTAINSVSAYGVQFAAHIIARTHSRISDDVCVISCYKLIERNSVKLMPAEST